MPVSNPGNPSGYVSPSLFPTYRTQAIKEDMPARQNYALLRIAGTPISTYLVDNTVPPHVETYAMIKFNASSTTNATASNNFIRAGKLAMVNHFANKILTRPVMWCTDPELAGLDCKRPH